MSTTYEQIMANIEKQREHERLTLAELHAPLFNWLRTQGVAFACLSFDGSGDSGQIEEVAFYSCSGRHLDDVASLATTVRLTDDKTVQEALEDFTYQVTDAYDWVNNEGGCGEVWFLACDPEQLRPDESSIDANVLNTVDFSEHKAGAIFGEVRCRVITMEDYPVEFSLPE